MEMQNKRDFKEKEMINTTSRTHTHIHTDFLLHSAIRITSVPFIQSNFSEVLEEQR